MLRIITSSFLRFLINYLTTHYFRLPFPSFNLLPHRCLIHWRCVLASHRLRCSRPEWAHFGTVSFDALDLQGSDQPCREHLPTYLWRICIAFRFRYCRLRHRFWYDEIRCWCAHSSSWSVLCIPNSRSSYRWASGTSRVSRILTTWLFFSHASLIMVWKLTCSCWALLARLFLSVPSTNALV